MKQVEEEYYKLIENHPTDSSAPKQSNGDLSKKDTIIPITPLKPILDQARALPPELLEQIVSIAKAESSESQEKSKDTIEKQG
jgi:hypothetical protein